MVDFLATSVTDDIRPFTDSDLIVRRRWYRVPWGTPTIGVPTVFMSRLYSFDPWGSEGVGSVWPMNESYDRGGARLVFNGHQCGTDEELEGGTEFDPTVNVVYDSEWIPSCCEASDMCVTQLCSQDQVNARPAAQLRSYPIPHQDATEFTPMVLQQWALNQGNHTPAWSGYLNAWFPGGEDGGAKVSEEEVSDENGVPQFREYTFRRAVDEAITERDDTNGRTITVEKAGVSGTITFKIVAGVLELCGTNAVICAAMLPPGIAPWTHEVVTAVGTTQAGAAAITKPSNAIIVSSTAGAGVRLPVAGTGPTTVTVLNVSATKAFKVYPGAGDAFIPAFVANAPIDLPAQSMVELQRVATNQWMVVTLQSTVTVPPPPPPATGTVESVSVSTSSAGLTVGVTDPTVDPIITIDLADELEQLVAFAGTAAIPVSDGAGNWDALGIGAFLSLTAGTLAVTPPTATRGEKVCTTFVITAAGGTYQATGNTFTIATAGTYLITGKIRADIVPNAAGPHFITAKLRNNTAGADVANSETWVVTSSGAGNYYAGTAGFTAVVTITGSTTFELYAFRAGTAWTTSQITNDTSGRTVFEWVRLF